MSPYVKKATCFTFLHSVKIGATQSTPLFNVEFADINVGCPPIDMLQIYYAMISIEPLCNAANSLRVSNYHVSAT